MDRRDFIRLCAAAGAAQALPSAGQTVRPRSYARAKLVAASGAPLRASALTPGRNYIFHFPYRATPCFLLDLGRPTAIDVVLRTEAGAEYRWPGGVGPRRSIVAYSAICTHRLTHPTRQISFISYREKPGADASRASVIHCCSEHSEYDPASGSRVLGGPAPQPLAAILLEHDATTDGLAAVGTLGGEVFDRFFEQFEFRLAMENGTGRTRQHAGREIVVTALENYCRQQVRC
jgi:Rieske Fe-S protein